MVRPKASGLTENELAIMKVLWKAKDALAVADILAALNRKPKPAYTSLLTVVRTMEEKGYVAHNKDVKAHLYYPVLKPAEYKKLALKKILNSLFDNNAVELTANLLRHEKLSEDEKKKIRDMLDSHS